MQRGSQDNDLIRGLTDYLETLQSAGVDTLPRGCPQAFVSPEPIPMPVEPLPMPSAPVNESKPEMLNITTADRAAMLQQLTAQVAQCAKCAELVANRTQTVFGVGNPYSELVFLGEAPGADEDRQGIPFVGRAGKLLTDMIEKGMKLNRDDVYICNILRCRPPGNRNPAPDEAAHCRPFLDATLQIIRPKFICCLGSIAATNLLNTLETIGRLRGRVYDYKGIKVVCTYHPAYLLRNPPAKSDAWNDLKLLMREMGLPVP